MDDPEGLKRMRHLGYPWINSAADMMTEMAKVLERYEFIALDEIRGDSLGASVDRYSPAAEILTKYREWK